MNHNSLPKERTMTAIEGRDEATIPEKQKGSINSMKKGRRRKGVLRGISSWWKRRQFYIAHNDSRDNGDFRNLTLEASMDEEDGDGFDTSSTLQILLTINPTTSDASTVNVSNVGKDSVERKESFFTSMRPLVRSSRNSDQQQQKSMLYNSAIPFHRSATTESHQGSLESMDSVAESDCDPEESASEATPVVTNVVSPINFFKEHVDFLREQTQPRRVEVVWGSPSRSQKVGKAGTEK
jgi:hypothetical protein